MDSLYEKLVKNGQSDFYPYHMPGHKRQPTGTALDGVLPLDITEIDSFDNLHQAEGIIAKAQEKAAELFHSGETFYLVNGSTCGILSALSAATCPGEHILMARNCHKSAYHGIYLRNLKVSYLYPECDEYGIARGIRAAQVREALERDDSIHTVMITSPTYEGRVSEVREIAELVHERNGILIVDEAHGAHFGFHPGWPENSNQAGADLVIQSVHKTLPSMTQTALLHVNGQRVDRERLKRFLRIYQTSSPSYVLMASIEQAVRGIEENGKREYDIFLRRWNAMLQELDSCEKIETVATDDPGKLVLSVKNTDLTGREFYDCLRNSYHLQLEMCAPQYVLAMFTASDTEEGFRRMTEAVLEIDRKINKRKAKAPVFVPEEKKEASVTLTRAWDSATELIPVPESAGRKAGEFISLYPPGIPILVPGEEIFSSDVRYLESLGKADFPVQGVVTKGKRRYLSVIKTEME